MAIDDHLIDTVARGMTAGQPSDLLRATVRRRVSTPDGWGTGRRPWAVAAAASVLGAAALVVGVSVWPPSSPGRADDPQVARVTPSAGQPRTPDRAGAFPAPAGDAGLLSAPTAARQVLANDLRDDPDSRDTVRIAPLVVTPLGIALLRPAEVDIAAVPAPETVVIGEIEVTPLRLGETQDGLVE